MPAPVDDATVYAAYDAAAREGDAVELERLLALHRLDVDQVPEGGDDDPALLVAASKGHLEVVDVLLHHGANVEQVDCNLSSPCMVAAYHGRLEIVQRLLDAGANVHHQNCFGSTALSFAAEQGHVDVLTLLIAAGARVDHVLHEDHTPLILACKFGHTAAVEVLLRAGADARPVTTDGFTALRYAVENPNGTPIVRLLLEHHRPDAVQLEHEDNEGLTPLLRALNEGDDDIAELLIAAGADIHRCDHNSFSALHFAAMRGCVRSVRRLLERGVDLHSTSCNGDTALAEACEVGHPEIVELLLLAGADPNCRNPLYHRSALHYAVKNGHLPVVNMLVDAGCDVSLTDGEGKTAMQLAEERGDVAIATTCFHASVRRGDDAGVRASIVQYLDTREPACGRTASMVAARHAQLPILRLLVFRGANLALRDDEGWTVLHHASERGDVEVLRFLLTQSTGVDLDAVDINGQTPLDIAKQSTAPTANEAVQILTEAHAARLTRSLSGTSLPVDLTQVMSEVTAKIDNLHTSVRVAAAEQGNRRDYPGLWSLEYLTTDDPTRPMTSGQRLVLSIRSEISGLCFHEPIVLEAPDRILAKHGVKIKFGLALFTCLPPGQLLQAAFATISDKDLASFVNGQVEAATQIHDMTQRLQLEPNSAYHTESGRALSPDGTMAFFLDLLAIVDPTLKRLKIADLCGLECALDKTTNRAVWAHREEILAHADELELRHDYQPPTKSRLSERASSSTSTSSIASTASTASIESETRRPLLKLVVLHAAGIPSRDWRRAYCEWELVTETQVLAAGATGQSIDDRCEPVWQSQAFILGALPIDVLRESRLRVTIKRPSRNALVGKRLVAHGHVELEAFVHPKTTETSFKCGTIDIPLENVPGAEVACQIFV